MNVHFIRQLFSLPAAVLMTVGLPQSAEACAACFGRSDDAMAHGMNMGIFTLLFVIVAVLVGIASVGLYFVRRASRMAATQSAGSAGTPAPLSQSISKPTP